MSGKVIFPAPSAPPSDQCSWSSQHPILREPYPDQCHNFLQPLLPKERDPRVVPPPDVVDNEPQPSAPSLDLLEKVPGYENASFEALEIPPPLIASSPKVGEEKQRAPLPVGPLLSEQEARQALKKFAADHCCYGNGPARDMSILKIDHSCAFHYTLETFSEKRQTAWTFEPYTGGFVDGPMAGPAPGAWEIPVAPPPTFQNNVTEQEVPHTASIKMCHTCGGLGRKRCFTCNGSGMEYCNSCHGDGQKSLMQGNTERCFVCHGTGRSRCWKCNGDGMAVCRACCGTGQIKCFIQLTVTWTNHSDDHIVERSALPDEKIKRVTGQVVFEEEHPWVWPLNHFPDNTVNIASAQLVQKHASAFPTEKILMQRHWVRIVPVATVMCQWRDQQSNYFVYGFEQKVYAPDYPQTCCCGCILL